MSAFNAEGKAKREVALVDMRERKKQKRALRRKHFRAPPPCPSEAEQDAMIEWLRDCSAEDLMARLRDQEYRETLNSVFNYWRLRTQIKVLRQQRGWTQGELGRRAHMQQSAIARLENIYLPYDVTINTLLRLAHAFDVCLIVRFEDWGSLIKDILSTVGNPLEALKIASFDEWIQGVEGGKVNETT